VEGWLAAGWLLAGLPRMSLVECLADFQTERGCEPYTLHTPANTDDSILLDEL